MVLIGISRVSFATSPTTTCLVCYPLWKVGCESSLFWVAVALKRVQCVPKVRFRLHFEKRFQKSFPRGIQKHKCGSPQTSMIIQASHLSAPGPMSQRSSLPTRVPVQVSTLERLVICDG